MKVRKKYHLSFCAPTMLLMIGQSYFPYLFNLKLVNKGTRLVCGSGLFSTYPKDGQIFKVRLVFKDSSALIPMPLRSFGKSFNLKIE